MTLLCEGKVAIITGAARGIGREHALLFAKHGAKVVVNDLGGAVDGTGSGPTAQSVVDEIVALGGAAIASTASAIRSPAPVPTIPQPTRRSSPTTSTTTRAC